jgi:hypothetical protein
MEHRGRYGPPSRRHLRLGLAPDAAAERVDGDDAFAAALRANTARLFPELARRRERTTR